MISKDIQTRARFLLQKYTSAFLSRTSLPNASSIQNRLEPEQCIQLVNDPIFNYDIATFLLSNLHNDILVEVVVEYATSKGDHRLMSWLIENAPTTESPQKQPNINQSPTTSHRYPEPQSNRGLNKTLQSRALVQSCLTGFHKVALVLLQASADPFFDNEQAICMAAKYGHVECVKLLVQFGANLHIDDEYPLVFACREGHIEIVSYLLDNGALIGARRDCALHWASEGGYHKIVQLLLDRGADIHSNQDHALRWGTVHGHDLVVEILLNRGADIHSMDDYALRNAVKMRHLSIIALLLKHGGNVNANANEALKWAAEHGDAEVLDLLYSKH